MYESTMMQVYSHKIIATGQKKSEVDYEIFI